MNNEDCTLKQKSIIVVDDHPIVSDSIGMALASMGYCVQLASNACELRSHLNCGNGPDLVILDIGLPDADGIKLVSEIRATRALPVLIFSGLTSCQAIHACERNGASGFVEKGSKASILISAIDKVLSGDQFFPSRYIKWLKESASEGVQLSGRQEKVLRLLMAGHRNKDIADRLDFAEGYVKNIITELLQSFHVDSRQRLILEAQKAGHLAWPEQAERRTSIS